MEGGSPILEWVTYGIIGVVLLTLGILFLRTAWFFLSLLAIPVTHLLGRTRLFGGVIRRWGERGPATGSRVLDRQADDAIGEASMAQWQVPGAVRTGLRLGAVLGTLPGVWMAVQGARLAGARGESPWEVAGTIATAAGLVMAPGLLAGAAGGAAVGLLAATLRGERDRGA